MKRREKKKARLNKHLDWVFKRWKILHSSYSYVHSRHYTLAWISVSVNLPARFEVGRIKQWKFASFVRSTVATLPCLYVVVDWFGVPQGCGSGGVYFAISWQFRPFFFFSLLFLIQRQSFSHLSTLLPTNAIQSCLISQRGIIWLMDQVI